MSTNLDTEALDSVGGVWGGERMAIMDLSLRTRLVRVGRMGFGPRPPKSECQVCCDLGQVT